MLSQVIMQGTVPFEELGSLLAWNEDTRVHFLPGSLEAAASLVLYKHRKS